MAIAFTRTDTQTAIGDMTRGILAGRHDFEARRAAIWRLRQRRCLRSPV